MNQIKPLLLPPKILGITKRNCQTEQKKKFFTLYINANVFLNTDYILNEFKLRLESNNRYSILTRVSYHVVDKYGVSEWKMLGDQMGFTYEVTEDLPNFVVDYIETMKERLDACLDLYDIKYTQISGIQLLIYKVGYTKLVLKKNKFSSDSLGTSKDLINVSKTTTVFNQVLPLSIKTDTFGVALDKTIKGDLVEDINIKGDTINFTNRINKYLVEKKKVPKFDKDTSFYNKTINNVNLVLAVNETSNGSNIDIYKDNGMKLYQVVDTKLSGDKFSREVGNVKSYIDKGGIYNKEIKVKLDCVYPSKITGTQAKMIHPDWMVGTLDLETYNIEGISKTYAIGFHVKNNTKTFYIGVDRNSDSLIMRCLDAMLIDKYNRYTFYAHNFGRYDSIFILGTLMRVSELYPDKYKYNILERDDGTILCLDISTKVNNKTYSIKLADSYNFLKASLSDLCVTFDTKTKKTYFPYSFVNETSLFYIGPKPDLSYYNIYTDYNDSWSSELSVEDKIFKLEKDLTNLSNTIEKLKFYFNLPLYDWSLQDQTLKYLRVDLISLFEVIDKFKYNIYLNYNTHTTRSLTISGVAMDIFLRKYYDNNIPLINKKSLYNNIKQSYYGGITEVYKPYGKDLYHYDVNSLYPHSALNDMPGLNCVYMENINKNINECINDLFGFYYCKIKASDLYIGLLPVRDKLGISMPVGEFYGWYFSEELKFAYKHGYDIVIINGYKFNRTKDVFKKYINEIYHLKSTTKDLVMRSISKSLLNNLLGRFGMNIDKTVTKVVSWDEYLELLQYKKIKSVRFFGDKILLTYKSDVSLDICESHDVDYFNTSNNDIKHKIENHNFKENNFHDVSVAIASAITSYSRIYMNQVKLDILNKGGHIYYTDTDSIVTDIKLDDSLVGDEIGKFKLEYEVLEGYFISSKTYCIQTKSGVVIKSKGANSDTLDINDFFDLYSGLNVSATRFETKKDINLGSVTIGIPTPITLSANMYNKRIKLYDDNKWVDTKPIKLNNKYHTRSIHVDTNSKLYALIKNGLMYISFVILVGLCVFIYILTYEPDSEYDDKFVDDNYLDPNTEYNKDTKKHNHEDALTIKYNFNSFIDLFVNKNKRSVIQPEKKNWQILSTPVDKSIECRYGNSYILNELNNIDIKNKYLLKEIEDLKVEISWLKIDTLNSRIAVLDKDIAINNIIKQIDNNKL